MRPATALADSERPQRCFLRITTNRLAVLPEGWWARRVSPRHGRRTVWVVWDPSMVTVAVVAGPDSAAPPALTDAGFMFAGRCPAGSVWVGPATPRTDGGAR